MRDLLPCLLVIGTLLSDSGCSRPTENDQAPAHETANYKPVVRAPTTRLELEAKVIPDISFTASPAYDPEIYRRLGPNRWKESNNLAKWAVLFAATSTNCTSVEGVDQSDATSREELAWQVMCHGPVLTVWEDDVKAAQKDILARRVTEITPPTDFGNPLQYSDIQRSVACLRALQDKTGMVTPNYAPHLGRHRDGKLSVTDRVEIGQNPFHRAVEHYRCILRSADNVVEQVELTGRR